MKKLFLSFVVLCVGVFAMAQTSFDVCKTDGSTVEFAVAKVDSISFTKPVSTGAFSIAQGKKVRFSRGNLQCSGVKSGIYTWSLAGNQYDMLGTDNVSGSGLADKIDLFGWSGSTGVMWGISTSESNTAYAGDFADWGKNIGDGTYRTLTYEEWKYLLNTRTNASKLLGVARIKLSGTEYANGLILLPDSWTAPIGIPFKSGFEDEDSIEYATHQTFTLAKWQKLEAAGAVFLPASGFRNGSDVVFVQCYGRYWSATRSGTGGAVNLNFSSSDADVSARNYGRHKGLPVRLVKDLYAVTVTESENGTVKPDKTEATKGETITLTITPAPDYELATLTVKDASGNTITVTDNTFVMPASAVTITATFKRTDTKEYVDLGLPSGTKWATCNVGAYSPEIYGNYYAWGETTTKEKYSWYPYKYSSAYEKLTKYCTDSLYGEDGFTDELTTLETTDDAATANWGGKWRMPTDTEWQELIDNCDWTWTTDYNGTGVAGRIVTSKTNGNTIFLPAAGFRNNGDLNGAGSYGYYWSSSLFTDYPGRARAGFFSSFNPVSGGNYRCYGLSVRPVCKY